MGKSLSANTQAVLLLTAPLIAGGAETTNDLLTPREYKQVAKVSAQIQSQPADLLQAQAERLPGELQTVFAGDRCQRLLGRTSELDQAVEYWQSREIWVVSPFDEEYPRRIKERLNESAPPVLYGCGGYELLDNGGLAVVGSREVDSSLIEYTENVGRLTALAKRTIVSGGARGIDQAAMRGAIAGGGKSVGVLADSLERAAMNREHRSLLEEGNLVLISPYDPGAGFNIGHAMQRNKLIYALADAALVVNSDFEKGGTWSGAVEQLDKFHFLPVYVRADSANKGLEGLLRKGAMPWPNPTTADELLEVLRQSAQIQQPSEITQLSLLEF
jgi:predicted Rossmann fold nucleotide-binding protein DprA/Smf involved in DNA uptake